jgi:plastocyanin
LTLAGCSGETRVEALGGGALAKVEITILPKMSGDTAGGGAGTAAVAGYGHLKGQVRLSGTAPSLPPLVAASMIKPDDKSVCVHDRIPNEKLVVNGNAVKNVFVYLQKAPAGTKKSAAAPAEVTMDHATCTFVPHAMVVMAGQPVRILNDDAIAHNVHTNPVRNGVFNSGIGPKERTGITTVYKNAERMPVKVVCDFHTWMLAWHLPLDHPYGAVTGDTGEFEIRDLPAGKHRFSIVHEGKLIGEKEVTIEVDQTAPLDIEFSAADFKVSEVAPTGQRAVTLAVGR